MWSIYQTFIKSVNVKVKTINVDNQIFRLHYRLTFWFLLIISALLWGSDYYDNEIKCTQSRSDDPFKPGERLDRAIGRWCYVMGIFTVPRHFMKNLTNSEVNYPGVGPIVPTDTEEKLSWYQWVHVVLFIQAMFFYIPHGIWRMCEKKTIEKFVESYDIARLLDDTTKEELLKKVKTSMVDRIAHMTFWAKYLIPCEVLNFINVVAQWFINDWFLRGNFSKLGTATFNPEKGEFNPMDVYFPKVAKCTYYKFGPTGNIFNMDILCVLPHNLAHEKIYLILWYWYIFLIIVTALNLLYRLMSWLSHRWKQSVNAQLYQIKATYPPDPRDLDLVMIYFRYGEWLFLDYLLDNCDDDVASEIISSIATAIRSGNKND